jgi:hypothetical protein
MAVAGYKYRINGGSHVNVVVDVGLVRPYTFTGLLANTEYEIEASSYNEEDVESNWSAAVVQTTEAEGETPGEGMLFLLVDGDGAAWVDGDGVARTMVL